MKVIELNFDSGVHPLFSQLCTGDYIVLKENAEETLWLIESKVVHVDAKNLKITSGELRLSEHIQTQDNNDDHQDKISEMQRRMLPVNQRGAHHDNELDRFKLDDHNAESILNNSRGKFAKPRKK